MPYDTYSSFRSGVSSWLDVSDVTTTSLDDIIMVAEKYVNRKLRVELMETVFSLNSVNGESTLPSGYLESRNIYINRSPVLPLTKKTAEWLINNYPDRTVTGDPVFVAETAGKFIFAPILSSTDVVRGTYYAKPASLPGTSTINSVFTEYQEIYLWAALANAEVFLGRDQRMVWQQKVDEAIDRANKEDKKKKMSGSPLSASPG